MNMLKPLVDSSSDGKPVIVEDCCWLKVYIVRQDRMGDSYSLKSKKMKVYRKVFLPIGTRLTSYCFCLILNWVQIIIQPV
jgi:hypothetical protein